MSNELRESWVSKKLKDPKFRLGVEKERRAEALTHAVRISPEDKDDGYEELLDAEHEAFDKLAYDWDD